MSGPTEIALRLEDGLLVVDKPKGWTSMDVNRRLKQLLSIQRVGHLGTLDPVATGVLPIFFGRATRLIPYFEKANKEYLIQIQFGVETDTWDADGQVISKNSGKIREEDILAHLDSFLGAQEQIVPRFSAKKHQGKRFYEMARAGEEVPERKVPIEIFSIRLTAFDTHAQTAEVSISCSKGTYTRSIAHTLGKRLGVGAIQAELRRLSTGPFGLDASHTIDKIEQAAAASRWTEIIIPFGDILKRVVVNG